MLLRTVFHSSSNCLGHDQSLTKRFSSCFLPIRIFHKNGLGQANDGNDNRDGKVPSICNPKAAGSSFCAMDIVPVTTLEFGRGTAGNFSDVPERDEGVEFSQDTCPPGNCHDCVSYVEDMPELGLGSSRREVERRVGTVGRSLAQRRISRARYKHLQSHGNEYASDDETKNASCVFDARGRSQA